MQLLFKQSVVWPFSRFSHLLLLAMLVNGIVFKEQYLPTSKLKSALLILPAYGPDVRLQSIALQSGMVYQPLDGNQCVGLSDTLFFHFGQQFTLALQPLGRWI